MGILRSFFGCLSVRKGCKIIASIFLVVAFIDCVSYVIGTIMTHLYRDFIIRQMLEELGDKMTEKDCEDVVDIVQLVEYITLPIAFLYLLVCILFMYGVMADKPNFLLPWLVWSGISIVLTLILGFTVVILLPVTAILVIFILMLFFLAFIVYVYLVVLSHYQDLKNRGGYQGGIPLK